MTEPISRSSRRRARESAETRSLPLVRPLDQRDFFAWIDLYAKYLEELGAEYTDERGLRVWQAIERIPALHAIVIERAGHLAGFSLATPVVDALDGHLALEVQAIHVERLEQDSIGLESLVGALFEHAIGVNARSVTWRVPASSTALNHLSMQFGELNDLRSYTMPVRR